MTARWVSTDVAEASIECDEKALLPHRCREDVGVAGATESFVDHRVDVVTEGGCSEPSLVREILVELQPHPGDGSRG